jgi:hypothetical protein
MIEGLLRVATPKPGVEANEGMTDDNTLERVAIAGATAIQRLIAERDNLRNRAHVQQQDLVALSTVNKGLRGQIAMLRHRYVELATIIIAQLEQYDRATRDAMQDKEDIATPPSDYADLIALANRLKPSSDARPATEAKSTER